MAARSGGELASDTLGFSSTLSSRCIWVCRCSWLWLHGCSAVPVHDDVNMRLNPRGGIRALTKPLEGEQYGLGDGRNLSSGRQEVSQIKRCHRKVQMSGGKVVVQYRTQDVSMYSNLSDAPCPSRSTCDLTCMQRRVHGRLGDFSAVRRSRVRR